MLEPSKNAVETVWLSEIPVIHGFYHGQLSTQRKQRC